MIKLKKGSKECIEAYAKYIWDRIEELASHCKEENKEWIHAYIDIKDCLIDIIEEDDEMIEAVEDYINKGDD